MGPLGHVGIVLGVGPAWLMTLIAGLAGGAFPRAIAMFNLRSLGGSAAIAGFAMDIGYLVGTLIPIAIGGAMMARSNRYLEDGNR